MEITPKNQIQPSSI